MYDVGLALWFTYSGNQHQIAYECYLVIHSGIKPSLFNIKDRIVWSEKTLNEVKKGFLPGGMQTQFDIYVSTFYDLISLIDNSTA